MNTTRPSLLSRVRDPQDHASWREFDARYRDLILGFCTRRGLQLADAEDVRQQVMADFSRSLRSFQYDRSLGRFRSYLGRAVFYAICAQREGAAKRASVSLEQVGEFEAPRELEDAWEEEWVWHHYRLGMAKVRLALDPKSLEVFEELLGGRSVAEVAERFGMGVGAVYKIKQRVRDRLRQEIEVQVAEGEFPEL